MTGREMLITFEELLRATNPDLEFDITINTDLAYTILSRAQKDYVEINFLNGDTIQDNINAIRSRSNVLRNIIKRTTTTSIHSLLTDGGYSAIFSANDYWMFMSGAMTHTDLPTNDKGSVNKVLELDLIDHYDLQKKIRTINNEPVYKYIPIVLEGTNGFVFYLDKEVYTAINGTINSAAFNIVYLAYPSDINGTTDSELASSTHHDIVKIAVDIFIKEYKFLLGQISKKPNG